MSASEGNERAGGRGGFGAPPQTTVRLRRKNVAGGSAPRLPLGFRLRPRWGPSPQTPPERSLGRSPSGDLGAEPPATFLGQSRPSVWAGAPTPFMRLAGWAAVLGFAALTFGPSGLATRALTAHPPN
ncbi:MAG: hypothetical protein GY696_35930 [Gammaproteobacteria bacterium]|nr:hypothetical protein [Gammaproteobacteria bacterium]